MRKPSVHIGLDMASMLSMLLLARTVRKEEAMGNELQASLLTVIQVKLLLLIATHFAKGSK